MTALAHFFHDLGSASFPVFWLPLVLWTISAGVIIGIMNVFERKIAPIFQYHGRVALLWGLVAGAGGSLLFYLFPLNLAAHTGITTNFITIPYPVVISPSPSAEHIHWFNPFLLMGIATILILFLAVIRLIQLWVDFWSLHSFFNELPLSEHEVKTKLTPKNKALLSNYGDDIQIIFSRNIAIPCTFGWVKKCIVLPVCLQTEPQKINMALRHEMTHIKNKDYLINTSVKIIKAIFGFHPLVHKLAAGTEEYREIYCDQHVLQDRNISPKSYANLLLELAPQTVFANPTAVNMAVHPSTLKKRIQTMKTSTRIIPSIKWSITLLLSATLLISGLMACSDTGDNGITASDVQQTQANVKQAPAGDQPLFVVNGEKMNNEKGKDIVSRLNPKYIQSINVFKNKKATDAYGEAGKNGVVEIKLSVDKETAFNDLMDKAPSASVNTDSNSNNKIYVAVQKNPEIIGGQQALYNHLSYPQECKEAGIEGKVVLHFEVTKQGDVKKAEVAKGIGHGCDAAALTAIKQVKFTPGMQNGKAVNTLYSWPIMFKLSGDSQAAN